MKHGNDETLLAILREASGAISIEEIRASLKDEAAYRTVQRWLASLIAQGLVVRVGSGRATRYQRADAPQSLAQTAAGDSLDLPLSEEGREIYDLIRRPKEERDRVEYRREFLESYIPNHSSYLSSAELADLKKMSGQSIEELPAGTYARRIMDRLLIDLSWNSSRLEGNTYSFLETDRLLNMGESVDDKSAKDALMILNHKDAIEFLVENAEELSYSPLIIRNIHALLSDNLMGDPSAGGRVRTIPVNIHGTRYNPCNTPAILDERLQRILETATAIKDPYETAFFLLVHLPYLQPFEDVNKRTSRIACNIPLIKANLCPLSFVDVPTDAYIAGLIGVYELNRTELLRDVFLWAYHRSTQRYALIQHQIGEPDPLRARYRKDIRYLVKEVVEQGLGRSEATRFIQQWASEHLERRGRPRFVEAVEQELLALDPGNFARYKLRLSVFESWKEGW